MTGATMSHPSFQIPGLDDGNWDALHADMGPWLAQMDEAMTPELRQVLDEAKQDSIRGDVSEYKIGTAARLLEEAASGGSDSLAA